MTNEIAVHEDKSIISMGGYDMIPVEVIMRQTEQVKTLMQNSMTNQVHYGRIPGCGDKPTLLQPGAQKLTMMFGLADTYDITREDMPNGHREYTIKCTLVSKNTGLVQGSGVGLCSTMEKKYRFRNVSDFEITDMPIPNDAKERKQEYRRQGFGMKKVNGQWCWVKYKDSSQQENPDIADTYNTVLKMACKRALVSAVLNTLAVSDVFTQDIEDLGRYAIDFQSDAARNQPQATQAPSEAAEDPRRELWAKVAKQKAQALDMGFSEEVIRSWMHENITNPDGSPKATNMYKVDEVSRLIDFMERLIKEQPAPSQEPQEFPSVQSYETEDIPF